MLKKGDQCYVRLMSGEIVEAKYDEYTGDKEHFVILGCGTASLSVNDFYPDGSDYKNSCRFVCMTGIKGKDNEARD